MATQPKAPRKKLRTLGVVFHELTSGFYSLIMAGIDLEAFKLGYQLLITVAKPEEGVYRSPYEMLAKAKVDGLIILDSTITKERLEQLKAAGQPMVLAQASVIDPEVSCVMPDNVGGAYLAMHHILSLGYRDILIITGPPAVEDSILRMEGAKKALEEKGLSLNDVGVVTGDYTGKDALHAFRNYLERHNMPRAIFAFNDDMALAIMKEFRQSGIQVPEEVAVVGFDGIDASDLMGLTTIKVPMVEVGREAVRLVDERIQNPNATPRQVTKETTLVVRESCGAKPPAP